MVTAQSDQLFADGAATIVLPLALSCMRHDSLHLLTALQAAVGISALASMHQRLDAALDGETAGHLWILCFVIICVAIVYIETELLHAVRMSFLVVASHTEIEILWRKQIMQVATNLTGSLTSQTVQW
jgi:hypothetical protein